MRRLQDWETSQNQLAFKPQARRGAITTTGTPTPTKRPRSSSEDSDEEDDYRPSQKEARTRAREEPLKEGKEGTSLELSDKLLHVTKEQQSKMEGIDGNSLAPILTVLTTFKSTILTNNL